MDTTSTLLQQRREKADSLAEAGVRLFSNTFKAPQPIGEILPFGTALAAEAHDESGRRLRIAGRVMSMRRFGKAAFFHLQDAEHRIQVYARRDLLGETRSRLVAAYVWSLSNTPATAQSGAPPERQ